MSRTHVVVGIIPNDKHQILIAQRPLDKAYSGYWEFPGGKKEPQESSYQTLVREFKEELNIDVLTAEPWREMEYTYPERTVLLDIWIITKYSGLPEGMEKQAFQWVGLGELDGVDFLPANRVILAEVVGRFGGVG